LTSEMATLNTAGPRSTGAAFPNPSTAISPDPSSSTQTLINNKSKACAGSANHSKEMSEVNRRAFNESRNVFEKILFVFVMISYSILLILPDMVLYRLGIRNNNNRKFRLRRVTTSPRIWIGEYLMPVASSNCVIIQGKDGRLLLRSPPEPTPNIVQAIRDEGEPAAILVTVAHDTYADRWKEMFPRAQVICPRNDMQTVNNRVHVDIALEDAGEFLKTFHVVRTISTAEWTRTEDVVLILQLENGKLAASFGCGIENPQGSIWSPSSWRDVILGRSGLGISRIYAYLMACNSERAQAMWQEIASIPNLDTLIFLHGEPIVGEQDLQTLMQRVNLSKMKLKIGS
jgi:hypothetical protein